jgi:NAD(P)-dependent dehydrogenase (short-subunit alcohol dehydrogenase family)
VPRRRPLAALTRPDDVLLDAAMPLAVVTGANSGIGKAIATGLAARGFHLVLVCRDAGRAEAARRDVAAVGGAGPVDVLLCDLDRPSSVEALAATIGERHPKIDVLVNNAGLYLSERRLTPEGRETMFAVNHLAPFLLTYRLADKLAGARVVTVSSAAHRYTRFDLANLEGERSFRGMSQYGLTKLANILFTRELARRGASRELVANCFHPGAVATHFAQGSLLGIGVRLGRFLLRTPEKGAETGIFLATSPEGGRVSGEYWKDCRVAPTARAAESVENARALWERSERLLGLTSARASAH